MDSDFEEFKTEIEDYDLRSANISQGVGTFGRLGTSIDRLTRDLSAIKATVAGSRSTITTFARTFSEIQGWVDQTSEIWPEIENRVSTLPKATQAMIKKNVSYKKAVTLSEEAENKSEQLTKISDAASSANTLEELKSAINDLSKLKTSLKGYQNFSNNIKVIEKLIPAFVCTKGEFVANLPKTGKCAPGYKKNSTFL